MSSTLLAPPPPPAVDQNFLVQAVTLQGQGQDDQALTMFERYLQAHPQDPVALYSKSVIFLKRGELAQALHTLQHGVQVAPHFPQLWGAYASALHASGDREGALNAYNRALHIKPDYTEALVNSGTLLREMHQHAAALERFNQVLAIHPDYETALGNCAILLTEFKRSEQAIGMFQRLLSINPRYDYGLGLLCYERMHICDWSDFDTTVQAITAGVQASQRVCKSLGFMAINDSAADHQRCAEVFAAHKFPASPTPLWRGERYRHDRIRIAYVSPDLREHPVGHLMAGIFERHDKQRFETIAISLGVDDNSRLRARMLKAFDHFIDARQMGSRQIAQLMRDMEVDVAIDLAGYTSDSRTDVFSHRPAPVQANYLGYPGTLGLDYIDYIVADRHVIPPSHQGHYTEKVVYLPDTYLPTDASIQIAERTPTRAECGLPEQGVVFCSFNHDYKISPHVFAVWMRLLQGVPGSVLWLMSRNEVSQRNLRAHAQSHGVDPDRLVFAQRVPRVEDHLARYRQADLFLDTHPYNAHTTAADALMAGLPVVTYAGQSFPSRVAGSLLHTVGLPELVTDNLADYEALALRLARDPQALRALKDKLAAQRAHTPLFDTAGFCRNLEALYTAMWRQSQLQGTPDALCASAPSDEAFAPARQALQQGNWALADLLCRQTLAQQPQHAAAQAGLVQVRQALGLPHDRIPQASGATRLLLIKAWGYGFWSDLDHVLGSLLVAELTGRTPLVLWGRNSLFRRPDTENAFEAFFQPVSGARLSDATAPGLSFYPEKWSRDTLSLEDLHKWDGPGSRLSGLYLLGRSEDVVVSDFHTKLNDLIPWIPSSSALHGLDRSALYRHLVKRQLHLQPALAQRIEALAERHLSGARWLAVHVRGTDKIQELSNLAEVNQQYDAWIERILAVNPQVRIFLLTDSTPVVDHFRARWGERVLSLPCERGNDSTGVHLSGHDGIALGEQVLTDAYLAARCDLFLGNGASNVSVGIRHLKDWASGTYFLIGDDFLGQPNTLLHRR